MPTSKNYLLVTGLLAGTGYQFSVLPQNKLGSGPFSEIVSVRTQGLNETSCQLVSSRYIAGCYSISKIGNVGVFFSAVPTEKPTSVTTLPVLDPPLFLSANRTDEGVLLQWWPPEDPSSPLTGFMLQARIDQGQWLTLTQDIPSNQSELLVQGLFRVIYLYCASLMHDYNIRLSLC